MEKVDLILKNATIITCDEKRRILKDQSLVIKDSLIHDMGDSEEISLIYETSEVIDVEGKYIFPGLINTHSHLFQVLTKGLGKDRLLWDWLNSSVLKMVPFISPDMAYYAALGGLMENIRSGCTTTLDFNYAHGQPGMFEAVWKAYEDLGIRGYVGRPHHWNDYNGFGTEKKETTDEYINNLHELKKKVKDKEMLDLAIVCPGIPGLLEQYYYDSDYLSKLRQAAEDLEIPYTMHMAETHDDEKYLFPLTGMRCIPFLAKSGFLSDRLVAAHCIKMKKEDIDLFKRYGVKVSHNPVSNMILASGIAPLRRFKKVGIPVSLGNDGAGSNDSNDMIETLKFANLLQKVHHKDPMAFSAHDTLELATNGGARVLCRDDIGSLSIGRKADLFIFNPQVLKSCPVVMPVESLVYTGSEANVETVIVNGRIILYKGKFTGIDENEVLEKLHGYACVLRKKSGVNE